MYNNVNNSPINPDSPVKILIIEDDASINDVINKHLQKCGYEPTAAFSGTEATLLLANQPKRPFDLIITDLMLPGLTGENLVEAIREVDFEVPIIVVSAKADASDKVDLLRRGADDYLSKPFDLNELTARVEVQLRRRPTNHHTASAENQNLCHFRDWIIDNQARTLEANGKQILLTRTEFDMLSLMAAHPTKVFSKQELYEHVWDEPLCFNREHLYLLFL